MIYVVDKLSTTLLQTSISDISKKRVKNLSQLSTPIIITPRFFVLKKFFSNKEINKK